MGRNLEIENIANELGLVSVYAYHCYRCNYTWLPRDFDLGWSEPGQELLHRPPPKSCARCKTRSWNIPPYRGSGESKISIKALERRRKLTEANLARNLNVLERVGIRFNRSR